MYSRIAGGKLSHGIWILAQLPIFPSPISGSATGLYDPSIRQNLELCLSALVQYAVRCMQLGRIARTASVPTLTRVAPLSTGNCDAVDRYPNASIVEYGTYPHFAGGSGAVTHKIRAEIFARGPAATGVCADPILDSSGGVVNTTSIWNMMVNHIVSMVGWGTDLMHGSQYRIVRNS